MIAATAALFAACAGNDTYRDVVENETDLIGFETYHGKATRAAVNKPKDLILTNGGFGVYGYKHEGEKTASNGTVSVSGTTNVFNNVQVWYVSNDFAATPTQGFTYEVPKYWDKTKTYTFFAYAPYVAEATSSSHGISFDETTGLFTRTDIQSLQSTNKIGTKGAKNRTQYVDADESNVIDYLIAPYVFNQKHNATNQSGKDYTGKEKTVGFTFYHILSKLNVKVQVKDEFATGGHQYKGVQDIQITKLNIENLPNVSQDVVYSQTSVTEGSSATVPAASYLKAVGGDPLNFTTTLNMIAGTNATAAGPLFILDGGSKDSQTGVITNPADSISQRFHYYIAPNTPTGEGHNHYKLNIDYTITYVDGTVDPFSRTVDLSDESSLNTGSSVLANMQQNSIYNVVITIALDQIYFDVDLIKDWVEIDPDIEKELN